MPAARVSAVLWGQLLLLRGANFLSGNRGNWHLAPGAISRKIDCTTMDRTSGLGDSARKQLFAAGLTAMLAVCTRPAIQAEALPPRAPEVPGITDEILGRWGVSRDQFLAEPSLEPKLLYLETTRLRQVENLQRMIPDRWSSPEYLTPRQCPTRAALQLIGETEDAPLCAPIAVTRAQAGPGQEPGRRLFAAAFQGGLEARQQNAACLFDGDGICANAAQAESDPASVPDRVSHLIQETVGAWEQTSNQLPRSLITFSPLRRLTNIIQLRGIESNFQEGARSSQRKRAVKRGQRLFRIARGEDRHVFEDQVETGVFRTLPAFVKAVRSYDPAATAEDLFQAGRNVWTANALQFLWDLPIQVTESVLGYSMLYPYSDNMMDGFGSKEKKKEFAARFRTRLEGRAVEPMGLLEKKVFDMVARIEKEWARSEAPDVYDSLLAIHSAQSQSLRQHDGWKLGYEDIVRISVEKGGTSVLADGYLVKGSLSMEESRFAFQLGYALQLIDDLQDLGEDLRSNHFTIFTQVLTQGLALDYLVNRLWNFLEFAIAPKSDPNDTTRAVRQAMVDVCHILIVEAVARHRDFFTSGYIKKMTRLAPIPFQYIHAMSLEHRIFNTLTNESLPILKARDLSYTLEFMLNLARVHRRQTQTLEDENSRRSSLRRSLRQAIGRRKGLS